MIYNNVLADIQSRVSILQAKGLQISDIVAIGINFETYESLIYEAQKFSPYDITEIKAIFGLPLAVNDNFKVVNILVTPKAYILHKEILDKLNKSKVYAGQIVK